MSHRTLQVKTSVAGVHLSLYLFDVGGCSASLFKLQKKGAWRIQMLVSVNEYEPSLRRIWQDDYGEWSLWIDHAAFTLLSKDVEQVASFLGCKPRPRKECA